MFKNLNSLTLGISGSQSELIELALTYGFKTIDIDLVEFSHRAQTRGLPFARRLFESAKLAVGLFPLPVDLEAEESDYQKQLAALASLAQMAAEIGATLCQVEIAPAGDQLPYHENFERHRVRLSEVCAVLEPVGIRLGAKVNAAADLRTDRPYQFIHEVDALGHLLSIVGAKNLGMVVNVWDLVASGGSIDSIAKMDAEQIVAVELAAGPADKPSAEWANTDRLVPAEEGPIDNAAVLKTLSQIGYDGPVSACPSGAILSSTKRDQVVRPIAEALNQVWTAAGNPSSGRFQFGYIRPNQTVESESAKKAS